MHLTHQEHPVQLEKYAVNCRLKCLYLGRSGRLDIQRSVNKLASAVTKETQACDIQLESLISYIHLTSEYRQYCHVGNTVQHCRLGLFQDLDFAVNFLYLVMSQISLHQLDV